MENSGCFRQMAFFRPEQKLENGSAQIEVSKVPDSRPPRRYISRIKGD
jgi:hypothetical protein